MVDATVDVPACKSPGAILSPTAEEARREGYVDAIEPTLEDALLFAGLDRSSLCTRDTGSPNRWPAATSPAISGLLLMLGFIGILIETFMLHGIAGSIGVGALRCSLDASRLWLFELTLIVLLFLGVVGILLELHVIPGHFVAGVIGTSRSWWRWCWPSATVPVGRAAVARRCGGALRADDGLSWRFLPRSAFAGALSSSRARPRVRDQCRLLRFLDHTGHATPICARRRGDRRW